MSKKEIDEMNNPQGNFENSIFGPHGTHPTPKTLPYPTQKINTIYGETVEYLIPDDRREEVLKELYPFGTPPSLDDVLMDIHLDKEFAVRDFKVIEQNGYVMLVSPYFAVDLRGPDLRRTAPPAESAGRLLGEAAAHPRELPGRSAGTDGTDEDGPEPHDRPACDPARMIPKLR